MIFVNFKLGGKVSIALLLQYFFKAFAKEKGEWKTKDSGLEENRLYFENWWQKRKIEHKRKVAQKGSTVP